MLTIIKTLSTEVNTLGQRIVKFLRFGKSDVRTAREVGPFGIDSNPHRNSIRAVYSDTQVRGKSVVLGYINTDRLAEIGGTRVYSTDERGDQQFYMWLHADGTMEMGGTDKNLVRFQELQEGFNQLKSDHNDLVNAFNTHMHATAAVGPPSTPTPGAGIPAEASMATIDGAKIDEIKTL